ILADKWALPMDLEYALVYHHNPHGIDKAVELVTTVHLADQMAHQIGADLWDNEVIEPEWGDACDTLGLEEEDYNNCLNDMKNNIDKSTEFLAMINYAE
ncbi:unnamed protein product, partial [marine sediment metagenome]